VAVRKRRVFVIPAMVCAGISWFQAQDSGIPPAKRAGSNRIDCFFGQTLINIAEWVKLIIENLSYETEIIDNFISCIYSNVDNSNLLGYPISSKG